MNIIKRDGLIQRFNMDKVDEAVKKAFASVLTPGDSVVVPEKFFEQLHDSINSVIEKKHSKGEDITVEDTQDLIQKELIKQNKYDVAEAFILYRNKRDEIREQKSPLIRNVQKALAGSDIQNQNANVDEASFGGKIGEAARVVTKNDALKNKMSKKSRLHHENNEIYIHDLDSYSVGMTNCLTEPIDDLLKNGFVTRQTDVRPASSVNTAMQLVAVLFQLQSLNQFGGVSASHLDWSMVPYVRKSFMKHYKTGLKYIENKSDDNIKDIGKSINIEDTEITNDIFKKYPNAWKYAIEMTKKEIYQAVEGLYHNLNTLQSRSGNQLPFTSINYGTCTLPSGRMVTEALLDVSIDGLGKYGKTSIFPCGIFQYMKGVNDKPGTPNYDLKIKALKSTAQRLYPNYVNVDWSVNKGYDVNDPKTYVSTMGKCIMQLI